MARFGRRLRYDAMDASELVLRAQNGDDDALVELMNVRCKPQIQAQASRAQRYLSYSDREDAEQRIVEQIMKSIGSYRGESAICSWMTTIAKRHTNKTMERGIRQKEIQERMEADPNVVQFHPRRREQGFEEFENKDHMAFILGALKPKHAEALRLRLIEGLKFHEMAERLHLSVGGATDRYNDAVRQAARLHRGLTD